jgi:hypothetical protein
VLWKAVVIVVLLVLPLGASADGGMDFRYDWEPVPGVTHEGVPVSNLSYELKLCLDHIDETTGACSSGEYKKSVLAPPAEVKNYLVPPGTGSVCARVKARGTAAGASVESGWSNEACRDYSHYHVESPKNLRVIE